MNADIREKIREARKEKQLTQEELATKSNVNRATIVALENGTAENVKISTLQKLAAAMNMMVQDMLF